MNPVRLYKGALRWASRAIGLRFPESIDAIKHTVDDLHIRNRVDKGTQILLSLKYRELAAANVGLPLHEVEFRNYSQNGEDGVLHYIFSVIGAKNKRCVEICAGDGVQCNTANLIINHGWCGLLFDGKKENIEFGQAYYRSHPDTFICPPILRHEWITAENINALIASNGFEGEIDLLSIDMDGMDYWIWNAIEKTSPRVVVVEVNLAWGTDRSVTAPYDPNYVLKFSNGIQLPNSGASLPALVKLGRAKGFRFVGCQAYGFNAFFVRNDVAADRFSEARMEEYLDHPHAVWARRQFRPIVEKFEWVDV